MTEIKIRDNPKLRSFLRNITEMSFTGIVWGIWIYLLLPVINLILWLLGFKYINIAIFEKAGYREFLGLLGKMGWIVLVVFLIMRLWGYYNYKRFGMKSRRKNAPPLTNEALAEHFRISVEEVEKLQSEKEIIWTKSTPQLH